VARWRCGGESNTVARDNQHALRSAFCVANQKSMAPNRDVILSQNSI